MNNLTGSPTPAAEGVVGIAPNARILAYKVCGPDGHCSDFAITQAIDQAVTDGARVINMSLGGADYSQALNDSVQGAWAAGLVIVAGAGNDGNTNLFYPAALDNVVAVGATDEDDLRASFSNYGNWVDVAAPGNVILSTYLMSQCSVSTIPGDIGCYAFNSGTSMATPHVSGAAALVWSRSDITSNWQVVDAITHGADGNGVSGVPINTWTVYGRLNLYGAMTWAAAPPPPPNTPPVADAGADVTLTDGNDGDGGVLVTLNGSASSDPDGDALSYEWREGTTIIGSGPQPNVFFLIGVHTVVLTVSDGRGGSSTDTVLVTINAPPPPAPSLSVTGISPNVVNQKAGTLNFVITGTGFAAGASVSFVNGSGPAPRVISVTRDSSTQLTARVEIRAGGPKTTRRWDVMVTNPGGTSATGVGLLTITP
jgi:subtilisin family serine protease